MGEVTFQPVECLVRVVFGVLTSDDSCVRPEQVHTLSMEIMVGDNVVLKTLTSQPVDNIAVRV